MVSQPGKVTVSVSSRVSHVDLIHAISDQIAMLVGFAEDEVLNVGLAVREATINAMKHGNGMDPRKQVRVVFEFDKGGMSVAVRDRGRGFDPNRIDDPTEPENLFRPNGRGILLMKAFVDRIEVHRDHGRGAEVVLFKDLQRGHRRQRRE